jgi:hypothetical protein
MAAALCCLCGSSRQAGSWRRGACNPLTERISLRLASFHSSL